MSDRERSRNKPPDAARGDAGADRPPAADEPSAWSLPIEDALDLHAFHPRDVPAVVEEYLHEAQRRGFREVRIIHGKGTGTQREIVSGILRRHPAVISYRMAPAERGHWGATVVRLRPPGEHGQANRA